MIFDITKRSVPIVGRPHAFSPIRIHGREVLIDADRQYFFTSDVGSPGQADSTSPAFQGPGKYNPPAKQKYEREQGKLNWAALDERLSHLQVANSVKRFLFAMQRALQREAMFNCHALLRHLRLR